MTSIDWAYARACMLLPPDVVYLNTGSFGPLPRRVFDHVTSLRRHLAEEPMDFQLRCVPMLLWNARERLADFIGGDPRQLVFTTNVTEAINLVASSLQLRAPGEILITDHEYETMHWCWKRAAKRLGLAIRTFRLPAIGSNPNEIVEAAVKLMTPQTRLFFFSHVLSSTGLVLPAKQLCDEAQLRGIVTVIDGAHGPAFVDLNLAEIQCDFYAGSGHKWLLAPQGVGFLYFGRRDEVRLRPIHVSWGYEPPGTGSLDERDPFGSTKRLRQFECAGTRDICSWLAVPEAIDFQATFGHEKVRNRMRELSNYVRRCLTECGELMPVTPEHRALSAGMIAFRLPDHTNPLGLQRGLWEHFRIETGVIERPDQLLIRVSTHFYNGESEVEQLADALSQLLHK